MKYILIAALILFLSNLSFAEDSQVHSYTVKGVLKKLPVQDSVKKTVMIKHEKIPNYVGADGRVVGMNSMTMPFGLAEKVNIENLKEGDCVSFSFDSWWRPKPADQITKIERIECQ